MIVEISKDNLQLINKFENTFSIFFSQSNYVLDDFKNNIFSKYFIYIDRGNIIGFVNYYDLYDRFEIANIYVLEMNRNNNIGSKMIEHLIEIGYDKQIKNITLEVNKKNTNAIKLYKKYDFIEVAIREKYYDGIDGILMERKMK